MTVQESTLGLDRKQISLKELCERKEVLKMLKASGNYAAAKLAPWNVSVEMNQYADVYRLVVTVVYKPLPPLPELIYEEKPKGRR